MTHDAAETPMTLREWADPRLPAQERARLIHDAPFYPEFMENGFTESDVEDLRRWATDTDPQVRTAAIEVLYGLGQYDCDDVAAWALDSDKSVRDDMLWELTFASAENQWSSEEIQRLINLLVEVATKYPDDYVAGMCLHDLSENDDWLDAAWAAAERILDQNDPVSNTMIVVTFFEHVISERSMGPNDLPLRSWITGKDELRREALERIAAYVGEDKGRMREIMQALRGGKVRKGKRTR